MLLRMLMKKKKIENKQVHWSTCFNTLSSVSEQHAFSSEMSPDLPPCVGRAQSTLRVLRRDGHVWYI